MILVRNLSWKTIICIFSIVLVRLFSQKNKKTFSFPVYDVSKAVCPEQKKTIMTQVKAVKSIYGINP